MPKILLIADDESVCGAIAGALERESCSGPRERRSDGFQPERSFVTCFITPTPFRSDTVCDTVIAGGDPIFTDEVADLVHHSQQLVPLFSIECDRNRNTRAAYAHAVAQFFAWCDKHRVLTLEQIDPVVIAAYIEQHPARDDEALRPDGRRDH